MCENCRKGTGPVAPEKMAKILEEEGVTEEWMESEHNAILEGVKRLYPEGFEWGPRDKIRAIRAIRQLPDTAEGIAIKKAWVALYRFESMAIQQRMQQMAMGGLPEFLKLLVEQQPEPPATGGKAKILGFGRPQLGDGIDDELDDDDDILKNFKTGTDN